MICATRQSTSDKEDKKNRDWEAKMSKILLKQLTRKFKTRAKAQAVCTQKNKNSRKYAYVVAPDYVNLGWYHILGIPKSKQ